MELLITLQLKINAIPLQGFPTVFTLALLKNRSDLAPSIIYNRELAFKRLEKNYKCFMCKQNQIHGQEKMTQINILIWSTK